MSSTVTPSTDPALEGLGQRADAEPAARAVPRWIGPVAAVVIGVLVGIAGMVVFQRTQVPGEDSADVGFARDMSTHHGQAVSMASSVYPKAAEPVRTLAIDITLTQQAQIGMMQAWLDGWGVTPNGGSEPMAWMRGGHDTGAHDGHGGNRPGVDANGLMPGMATSEEMQRLRDASGQDAEVLFLQLMIRHHQGGIPMVDAALAQAHDRHLLALARSMKAGQQHEIQVMTEILASLGAKPLPR